MWSPKACNLSIAVRHSVMSVAVGTGLVVMVGVADYSLMRQTEAANELLSFSRAQRLRQNVDVLQQTLQAAVLEALLVDALPGSSPEQARSGVVAAAEHLRADLAALDGVGLPEDLQAELDLTKERLLAYSHRAEQLGALALEDRAAALAEIPLLRTSFEGLARDLAQRTARLDREVTAAERRARDTAARARRYLVLTGLAVGVVVAWMVLMIGASIRRSIKRIRELAEKIASGELDARSGAKGYDDLALLSRAVDRMAQELQTMLVDVRREGEQSAFVGRLGRALEMADTEADAHGVVARAMATVSNERPMELLLADSSRAHLERAAVHPTAGAAGCGVQQPFGCIAIRRGSPLVFESSDALDACPRLRDRARACSAVCVPVSFMGRALGVLHATGDVFAPPEPDVVAQLTTLGTQSAARIGTVRAFQKTQLQATTDGLTGLANRRSIEDTVRELAGVGRGYALVIADLDHFKRLNDTYGHETGDAALRRFAQTLRRAVRGDDVAGRWGGEEFVLVLPGTTAQEALEVVERFRAQLAEIHRGGAGPAFTASFGVADASMGQRFEDVFRLADEALYAAKQAGRDRAHLATASQCAPIRIADACASIDVDQLASTALR